MSHPLDPLFDDRCLTPEELQGMADGTLSGSALHRAERHLVDCPLCNEALEGLRAAGFDAAGDFDALQHRVDLRVRRKASPITPLLRIAAMLVVVAVAGGIAWYLVTVQRDEKLYSQYYAPYVKPADTLPSPAPLAATADEAQPAAEAVKPSAAPKKAQPPAATQPVAATKKNTVAASENRSAQEATPVVADALSKQASTTDVEDEAKTVAREKAPAASGQAQKEEVAFSQKGAEEEKEVAADEVVTTRAATTRSAAPAPNASAAFKDMAPATLDVSQLQRAPLQEAIRLYEEKQYGEAYARAEAFLKKFPGDAEGLFYSGVSAMNDGRTKTAAKRLQSCLDTGSNQWKEEASWYLALCYVKLDKVADARPLLQFLAGGRSVHATEAQQLLQSLH